MEISMVEVMADVLERKGPVMAQNTFKFQSFTQRIAKIKIDAVHRIGEARQVPDEEQDTFFRECLIKWTDLNCTQDFANFHKEVQGLVQNLKQLLFYKDTVFEILCRHLEHINSLCLDALLDLMAQLTRDLQYEIYPHFEKILNTLAKLLNSHDADIIENTFVCLAFIFKYLWRYMVDDSSMIFGHYKKLLLSCQKPHIRQFVAESIAFLVRKLKDKDSFLDVLFKAAEDDPNLVEGVGILLFETVKGVGQIFHSCAGDVIALGLKKLAKNILQSDNDIDQVFECLEVTFKASCKHASKDTCGLLWDCLFLEIRATMTDADALLPMSNQELHYSSKLTSLVKLIITMVQWKYGLLIGDFSQKIQKIMNEILATKYSIKHKGVLLQLFALLIQTDGFVAPFKETENTLELIFKSDFEVSQISDLMKQCKTWHLYRSTLLPKFVQYIETNLLAEADYNSDKSVTLIKCLCQQVASIEHYFTGPFESKCDRPPLFHFMQTAQRVREDGCISVADVISKHISWFCSHQENPRQEFLKALDRVWCCVVLLPYLRPLNTSQSLDTLLELVHSSIAAIPKADNGMSEMLIFIISQAIRAFYLIKSSSGEIVDIAIDHQSLLSLLQQHPSNSHILQALELHYKQQHDPQDKISSNELFQNVFDIVKSNLSSHLPTIRHLTLLILLHLSTQMESPKSEGWERTIVKCLNAEKIPATFEKYLERLLHLRKLVLSPCEDQEQQSFSNEVFVRYLVGNLRIKLRPMWSPIMEVLKTHEENGKQFWPVFRELFMSAFESSDSISGVEVGSSNCFFSQYISLASVVNALSRSDSNTFRLLMCQAMEKIPQLVESKSRDVLPIFFTFLSKEFGRFDDSFAATQDLITQNHQVIDQPDEMASAIDSADEHERKKQTQGKQEPNKKFKILKAFLSLFSKFKNPRALYNESKLYEIYLEMLMHRDNELQQLVCNCLKTYKFEYLKPYEEQIDKLFQANTFRDALTLFSASDENQSVKLKHRNGLINILIRLLYGKLQRRSGLGVGGKTNQSARRNIIINFISCCPDEEVTMFINLITHPFKQIAQGCLQDIDIDLHYIIPLRKQIGFLNMLHTVLTKLSSLIGKHTDHLFMTLLNILKMSQSCLDKRHQISSPLIGKLKSIRQLCISRVADFFEIFQDFNFEPYVEMIFGCAVIPQVSRLSSESQQHPSPLLKLLHYWSSCKKYFHLLNKDASKGNVSSASSKQDSRNVDSVSPSAEERTVCEKETGDGHKETPLMYIFSILSAKDKSDTVVKMVMSVAENILQMQERPEVSQESVTESSPTCAVEMILPHVNVLLNHFCDAIRRKKSPKLQKDGAYQAELTVLALISSFARDPQQCQTIVSLLFPTLKVASTEQDQSNTLITIKNLVQNCENTKNISAEMVNLFMNIKHRKPRVLLCDLFGVLSKKGSISEKVPTLISDMNSWDPKYIDEPNFEIRLKAFSTFTTMLKAKNFPTKEIKLVLANCLFHSVESHDMSLRDASISCIHHVIDFVKDVGANYFGELIQGLILPVVRNSLRSRNEVIRGEYTGILAKIIKDFDDIFISDMKSLTSNDPEVDFFENIKHIQIHRRIRAVRQLQKLVNENALKENSLFFFLLPLISHFVFDYTLSKDHNLVTATIEATGSIMSCMSWQRYSHFLRSYLRLLPKEKTKKKTIIRIVDAILDAFHFDLSMLNETDIQKEKSIDTKDSTSKKPKTEINEVANEEDCSDNEANTEEEANEDMSQDDDDSDYVSSRTRAIKIHQVISTSILPQLQKSMVRKSFVEDFHRKSHNKEIDEEAVLRVPIALALVKLLQKLPKTTLHEQLPGILLRVCQTLKSRARDVRDTARDTLVNIAASLGPEYFPFVLKEMKSVLQRGYQLHVLAFTLKSLFDGLMEQLKPGDFDQCLSSIIQTLVQDLFENVTEEKEAVGITGKLHEAKSTKSYDSFEIISRFATPSSFKKIVESVKEVLENNHTHKTSNKAQEVLRRIGLGLQNNSSLTLKTLLIYIHQTLMDLQPHLKDDKSKDSETEKGGDGTILREDIYLVKREPGRGKKAVESSKKANLHVVAEFTLQLFHSFLKNQRLQPSKVEHNQMLDPYVKVLIKCLKSKYNRVIILAAKSIAHLIRFPLPSFQANTNDLASALFKLLKNYARIGAGTGENYELVLSSFKAMTVIIRDNKKFKATNEQLKILLTFVEEDIYDYTRQATAFPLLKAILSRKMNQQEIIGVMKKIAELSITSETDSVQLQCRQLMMQFLLDYPLGKKIEKHLEFYISHLEYNLESGRKSSLEMLALIFKNFPEERLGQYSGFFYFPLVMRLVNDESPICRKLTNAVLKMLLQKLQIEKRSELFELTLSWFQQDKISVKKLAAQAIGIFAEVEKSTFEKRLSSLLPQIKETLIPDLYSEYEDDEDEIEEIKSKDQLLFNTLSSLMKLTQYCDVLRKPLYQEDFNEIWGNVQNHLQHAHAWVRLASCQLFSQLFAAWEPIELVGSWKENKDNFYLTKSLPSKVKMLCQDFCEQLKSDLVNQELGEQIAKNLIYMTRVINVLEKDGNTSKSRESDLNEAQLNEKEAKDEEKPPTLRWLLTKLSYLASYEASKEQKAHIKRICVFRCLGAVSLDLGKNGISPFMIEILRPLHRELNSSPPDSELHKLAQEVVELIKEIVGKELFAEMYSKLQRKVSEKKESRKRKEAEEAVINPMKFAQKKQRKNLMKRDQRKRKLIERKPSLKHGKKSKTNDVAVE